MGRSDAFEDWYEDLDDTARIRCIAGVPLGRLGDPEHDIGAVVAFLASRDAGFITGRTIFVDGGRSFYDR
jgi:NAD(P)-dependent dehydrogenase (short-subunit alcohol dehydrogenase family)